MRRAKTIFLEAIDLPEEARPAFLDDACADDAPLRAAVQTLISAHERAGRFMAGDDDPSRPPVPSVGPYRLERLLGEGGWGQVWLGEQREPVSRRVAIKLIRPVFAGALKADEVVARFESERQVLAMLDHPGIARMLDAGAIEDGPLKGLPYFVMDYVEGRPITHFADERNLSIDERLDMVARVCEAVHHAHASGIIHRDIKPSNVLAGEAVNPGRARRFRVRVIDFGIAKAMDPALGTTPIDADLTHPNTVLGTPTFMSPEQAAGGLISTRSDIFSLGVLLFELLVGTTPRDAEALRRAGALEMRRILVEERTPSLLARFAQIVPGERERIARARQLTVAELRARLSGDLDWITRRALAQDPEDRYASAAALAADIRRHLDHVPVEAAPPTLWYLACKFVQRRRAAAIATSLAALAILVGVVGAGVGIALANAAAIESRREAIRATEISRFLREDMLGAITPSMAPGQGRDVRMVDVLAVAVDRIDAAEGQGGPLENQPAAAAEVRLAIGTAYNNLGLYDEAALHISRAIALRDRAMGAHDIDTLPIMSLLAHVHRGAGDYEQAEDILLDVLPHMRTKLGTDHRETLLARRRLALLLSQTARLDESLPMYRDLHTDATRALGADDDLTLDILGELATVVSASGHADEGVDILTTLFDQLLHTRGPDAYDTVITQQNLAAELMMAGRNEEAERILSDNAPRMEALHGAAHANTVNAWTTLAMVRQTLGRLDEASTAANHAVECAAALESASRSRIVAERTLAGVLGAQGHERNHVDQLESLMPRIDAAFGRTHYQAIASLDQLGEALWTIDRRADALDTYRDALDRAIEGLSDAHPATFYIRDRLAFMLIETDDFDEATAHLEAGHAAATRALGAQSPVSNEWLAKASIAQARWFADGPAAAERVRAALDDAPDPTSVPALMLALAWCDQADRADAADTIDQVLGATEPGSVLRRLAIDLGRELGHNVPAE